MRLGLLMMGSLGRLGLVYLMDLLMLGRFGLDILMGSYRLAQSQDFG